jgi:hypothetical protein
MNDPTKISDPQLRALVARLLALASIEVAVRSALMNAGIARKRKELVVAAIAGLQRIELPPDGEALSEVLVHLQATKHVSRRMSMALDILVACRRGTRIRVDELAGVLGTHVPPLSFFSDGTAEQLAEVAARIAAVDSLDAFDAALGPPEDA